MSEVWKPITGFEDYYAVSNRGRIKRMAPGQGAIPGRILSANRHRNGYRMVTLSIDGIHYPRTIHSLVAETFLGEAPAGHQVNHKNGDKADNRLDNLEWVTPLENTRHAWEELGVDFRGENSATSKLTEDEVNQIRRMYGSGRYTQAALAEQFGVCFQAINCILHRKTWAYLPRLPEEKNYKRLFSTRRTEEDVRLIRRLYATGDYTMTELGDLFDTDSSQICRIVNRQIWADVPDLDASPEVRALRNRQATQGRVR